MTYWSMECHHCAVSYTTGADGTTHPLCPRCENGRRNKCPKCGSLGRYHATGRGAGADEPTTDIFECHTCVQHGVGIDDVPYTFPLHFGSDGKVYI